MRLVIVLSVLFLHVFLLPAARAVPAAGELPDGVIDRDILNLVFSTTETLRYDVSWTGGIKIGELDLSLEPDDQDGFAIHARVVDVGIFHFFYPVNDVFTTYVRGADKLPYRYEVLQREGRGSVTRRLTVYDQQKLKVRYRRDDEAELVVDVAGPVYNEFSSFYITRVMRLPGGGVFMVPTFADKRRNEVKVRVLGREELKTSLGRVRTVAVAPIMEFKGLYDKDGDTVIWLTDDVCRIPVRVRSRIAVGSLTARLVEFSSPSCPLHRGD